MNCRFVVCIAVYNNPSTILNVITSCLAESAYPIIVVDDGSATSVEDLFHHAHLKDSHRVTFRKHASNKGKGAALQTAFQVAIKKGFTHAISIDGDGQHFASDINKLAQESMSHPWALIVGDRDMQTAHVPKSSLFGRKFSNFWVQYQTNVNVADSQSGFRIYPLFYIQNMKFICKKYDFEIEVLIRLIWKDVLVKNVKVSVRYFPKEIRVSHFHKWKDNYRISIIHTLLIVVFLLREQTSPLKSSSALGLGVFIGTLPLYGLHTVIVVALAFALRLNFIYLWLGTNISLPPLIPLLLFGSRYIGKKIIENSPMKTDGFGTEIALGSPVLGIILGLIAFAILYNIKRLVNKKKSKLAWTGDKNKWGVLILRVILKNLGLNTTYFILHFVAFYYYLFSFRTRKSLNEYWQVIRPPIGYIKRQFKIYSQILIFAKTLVDRGLQRESEKLIFEFETDPATNQFLQAFKESQKGLLTVTSHIGGWELVVALFSQIPTNKKVLSVMYGIDGQYKHQSSSNAAKSEVVFSNLDQSSILKVKNYLSSGQIVGMMGDRPRTNSFELVPFFRKLAAFDTTPIRTALICQADIYFIFSVKIDRLKYKLFVYKALPPENKNRPEQIDEVLRQYVSHLESILQLYPEQWFNFFPFWSERVESEA